MCGILGYTMKEKPSAELIDGFRKLFILTQNRGHHASGIAWEKGGRTQHEKGAKAAREFVKGSGYKAFEKARALTAVAHTRWATNGKPENNENNHPHMTDSGSLALVHNGMVFNWEELAKREKLPYNSECDSEVILRMIEKKLGRRSRRDAVKSAVKSAVRHISGSASFALMNGASQTVFLVCHQNPVHILVLPGQGVVFASEASALWAVFGSKAKVLKMAEDTMLTITGDSYTTTRLSFASYRVPVQHRAAYHGAATGGRAGRTETWWEQEEREEKERRAATAETFAGWYEPGLNDDTPPTDYMESRGLSIDPESGQIMLPRERREAWGN